MKKKLLSLALVLAMALTLLPTAAFAADHDAGENGACKDATYTEVQGQAATCAAAGWKSYYTCSVCNNAFSDQGTTAIADLSAWKGTGGDGYIAVDADAHPQGSLSYGTPDENGHQQHCTVCNQDVGTKDAHTAGAWTQTATQHSRKCSVCEYEMVAAANHTFTTTGTPSGKCDICEYACTHSGTEAGSACGTCGVTVAACDGTANCQAAAGSHNANCVKKCTGTTSCPNDDNASYHNANCAKLCTEDENCPNAAGNASYHKSNCPKKSAPAVTIASIDAKYDGGTLTVTWTLSGDLGQDTAFTIKVDSDAITDKDAFTFTTDPMGGSSTACSFTKQVSIPDGDHTVIVSASGVTSTEVTITVSTAPSEPSQPSDGIPNPGSVTSPAAAESAIKNIQSSDADKIAAEIEKELADTSSNASTATIDKLEKLEAAVMDQANISVSVAPDSKAPDALNTKKVSIVGAALNAEKTVNTKIELQISAPKTERTLGRTYDNDAAVQFSMTLTNVVNAKKLAVPVVITMPLPSGVSASKAVVLHYSGSDSASQVLQSKVSGGYISFAVTGFSDFIITQRAERKTSSGGGGGTSTKVTNIPVTVTPTVPSAPAGIFTDVPAGHSFASQITWARDNGVMGGYSDGSFRPTNPTNRQQLWMVLARLSGAAPADMAAAREWAVNAGVSDGANGEGTLSRQQLVTMLYRYAQSQEMNLEGAADLTAYPDNAAVASYAQEALAWAVGKGIVTGTSDGRLNPEGTATRGQFAVIMYRFSHQG